MTRLEGRVAAIVRSTLLLGGLAVAACGSRASPPGLGVDGGGACEGPDLDGDGFPGPPCREDCDDGDPTVATGLPDPPGDGRDTDCDGVDGVDRDGDGAFSAASGGDDCDDERATVRPGAPDGQGWVIEAFPAGIRTQLALDRWGRPVVAWVGLEPDPDCENDDAVELDGLSTIGVSRWERGEWSTEQVRKECTNGSIGVGVGEDGITWVAYATARSISSTLEVANDADGVWTVEELGPGYDGVALVVDHDLPLVAYTPTSWYVADQPGGSVATRSGGEWRFESFAEGHRPTEVDLSRSAGGRIAASYVLDRGGGNDVGGAVRRADGWISDSLYEGGWPVSDTGVALMPSGDAVFSYGDRDGLHVLSARGAGWSSATVDTRPMDAGYICCQFPGAVAMEIDVEGATHIAYASYGHEYHVSYAVNRDGGWSVTDLASYEGGLNGYASLAVDADAGVHIAWYVQRGELDPDLPPETGRYAVLARPNDGIDQNCDGVDGVDSDGDGHASVETGGDDLDDTVPDR